MLLVGPGQPDTEPYPSTNPNANPNPLTKASMFGNGGRAAPPCVLAAFKKSNMSGRQTSLNQSDQRPAENNYAVGRSCV